MIFTPHGIEQELALLLGFLEAGFPILPCLCVEGVFVPGLGFVGVDYGLEDGFGGDVSDVEVSDGKRGLDS